MKRLSRRQALASSVGAAVAFGLTDPPSVTAEDLAKLPRPRADHYTTTTGGELIGKLTVSAPTKYRFSTLYILKVPGLRKGDVVEAHTQFEVTNDLGIPVSVAHAMLLHSKKTIVKDQPTQSRDRRLCEYAGEFLTPAMHHGFRTLVGSFTAESNGDVWISVVVYAVGEKLLAGRTLTVEKGYGGLRAIVFRNA